MFKLEIMNYKQNTKQFFEDGKQLVEFLGPYVYALRVADYGIKSSIDDYLDAGTIQAHGENGHCITIQWHKLKKLA